MMTINNCDSQSALHRQEIYSPQWLILCVMMRDIAFAATDVASEIVTFLNANYLKYQVMVNFLNQAISKGFQVSNYYLNTALLLQ